MKCRITMLAMVIISLCSSTTFASDTRQVVNKALPSIVLLVMEDENMQPYSLGSGFVIDENLIATNMHVIEGANSGYAKLVNDDRKYNISEVIAIDQYRDLAIVKAEGMIANSLKVIGNITYDIGDEIIAIGNPMGLEGTVSVGIISGIRKFDTDHIIQVTAPISPGSSGGPVLNSEGNAIGVAVATYRGGQNLNFAIPISYLHELVNAEHSPKPFSKAVVQHEKESIVSSMGDRNTNGVIGNKLAWANDLYECFDRCEYSITLKNMLREPVEKIYCIVIIYDEEEDPLDFDVVYYESVVPPGLGKRVNGSFDSTVKRMTTPTSKRYQFMADIKPSTRVECRVLNFDIVK